MKKVFINVFFLLTVIFVSDTNLSGQNTDTVMGKRKFFVKPILSTEAFVSHPTFNQNMFNLGFGGAFTAQFKRAKYSLGFNYSTRNYYSTHNFYYYDKIKHYFSYYNIPFTISFPLFNKDFEKKNDLIFGLGLIYNIPIKYEAFVIYNYPLPYPNPYLIPKSELGIGKSFQLFFRYQRRLNKTFDFYLSGAINYKFSLEYEYTPSMMSSWRPRFSQARLQTEINAGFELYYKR